MNKEIIFSDMALASEFIAGLINQGIHFTAIESAGDLIISLK